MPLSAARGGDPSSAQVITTEALGGIILLAAAVAAVVWANVDPRGYLSVWSSATNASHGVLRLPGDVRLWVTDGAMVLFFLLVGLELDRELHEGELADRRAAVLPVAGALGGMVGAAVCYLAVAHAGPAAHGYGVPMATDVAFALGALALLGRRVPRALLVFVLALAIADDLGSVVVLAVGYSAHIAWGRLAVALAAVAVLVVLRRRTVVVLWPYLLLGLVCWDALDASGVEPVLAGVAVGLTIPPGLPSDRLERLLGPVVTFVILPLFALANAGVRLDWGVLTSPRALPVLAGIVVARVVGKLAGIVLGVLVASRLFSARLPDGVGWGHLSGAALTCGIGFAVPLLFADRAFAGRPAMLAAARVGLYAGSILAFLLGAAVLIVLGRRARRPGGNGAGHGIAGDPTGDR